MAPPAVAKKPRADDGASFGPIAERFRRAGELDRAILVCREGLKKFPHHISARATLGWALLDLGQYEEARAELEQVLRRAPDNLAAIRGLAELHDRAEHTMHLPMDGPGQWPPPPDSAELAEAETVFTPALAVEDDAMVFTTDDAVELEPAAQTPSVMAPPEMGIPIWTAAVEAEPMEPAVQAGSGMSSVRELDPAADFASVGDLEPASEPLFEAPLSEAGVVVEPEAGLGSEAAIEEGFEPEVIYQPASSAVVESAVEPEPMLREETEDTAPDVDLAAVMTEVASTEANADVDLDLVQPAVVLEDGDIDLSLFDAPGAQDASEAQAQGQDAVLDEAAELTQPDVALDLSADVDLAAVEQAVEAAVAEVEPAAAEPVPAQAATGASESEGDVFELVAPTPESSDAQGELVDLDAALESEAGRYEHTGPDLFDMAASAPEEEAVEVEESVAASSDVEPVEASLPAGVAESIEAVASEVVASIDAEPIPPAVVVTGFAAPAIQAAVAEVVPLGRPQIRGQADLNQARIAALERFLVKVQARRRRLMAESVA